MMSFVDARFSHAFTRMVGTQRLKSGFPSYKNQVGFGEI